jgi:hypothetical protein
MPPAAAVASDADAVAEIAQALGLPDRLARATRLSAVLRSIGPMPIEDILKAYDTALVEPGDVEYLLLAEWGARHDPKATIDWAQRNGRGGSPAALATSVLAWARRDPESARHVVDAMPLVRTRQHARNALIRGWHESGRTGLVEYLGGLAPGQPRQLAISQLTRRMVKRAGAEATIRWAESIPGSDAKFRLNVYRRVASALVMVDVERAADWALEVGGGEFGKGLYRRVAVRWAERDGRAAMDWLENLPRGRERDIAVQETYRIWLGSESRDAAREFIAERSAASWLEPAAVLYLSTLAREDPQAAIQWIPRLEDAERRREATINVGRIWRRADPEAAATWMEQADLPDDVKRWIETPRQAPPRRAQAGSR